MLIPAHLDQKKKMIPQTITETRMAKMEKIRMIRVQI